MKYILNERLKSLRKALGLTQQKFAERIGVKQNTIAQYEIGRNMPIETVISLICKEFDVNEDWLRYGTGEMFIEQTRDERIASFVGKTLSTSEDSFKKRFISVLSALDDEEWEVLEKIAEMLHDSKKDS